MRNLFILLATCLVFSGSFAKQIPAVPNPPQLVVDYTGTLSADERQALEQKLEAYEDSTSNQIAIVIENSLDGDDLFDYSYRIAEGWHIGQKGKNNGILIYVALNDHKVQIQTGYGAEGAVPDLLTKRIREEHLNPNFRQGNYYQGLDEASDILIKALAGEYQNDLPKSKKGKKRFSTMLIVIIVIIILLSFISHGGGGRRRFWGSGPFYGTFGSGGFSGGGWGGSSSGSGGFGGFGGGSFGGGGSGGSW